MREDDKHGKALLPIAISLTVHFNFYHNERLQVAGSIWRWQKPKGMLISSNDNHELRRLTLKLFVKTTTPTKDSDTEITNMTKD